MTFDPWPSVFEWRNTPFKPRGKTHHLTYDRGQEIVRYYFYSKNTHTVLFTPTPNWLVHDSLPWGSAPIIPTDPFRKGAVLDAVQALSSFVSLQGSLSELFPIFHPSSYKWDKRVKNFEMLSKTDTIATQPEVTDKIFWVSLFPKYIHHITASFVRAVIGILI